MTQEDLLLNVLYDGLLYGIKALGVIGLGLYSENITLHEVVKDGTSNLANCFVDADGAWWNIKAIKPYLRDIEDMTKVEKQIYDTLINSTSLTHRNELNIWLNKKHFNWRGLPKDKYIKVTKENNPYK